MTIAVTPAITAEASAYTVTRFAAGTRANGVYAQGASSTVQRSMTVQPATPKEIQVLPEGIRNREIVKCHATADLRSVDQKAGTAGDRFAFNGGTYEVIQVADWSAFGGYWRALAARVQD